MKSIKFLTFAVILLSCCATMLTSCLDDDDNNTSVFRYQVERNELVLGGTLDVKVSGGTAPYKAVSSDSTTVGVSVKNDVITLHGLKSGRVNVAVTDAAGNAGGFSIGVKKIITSQNQIVLNVGNDTIVDILGGKAPFAASVKESTVATATVNGAKLTIKALKTGLTTVSVTDSEKNSTTVYLQVR